MVRDAAEVLRDALALPPEARAALVDSLIESLDRVIDEGAEEAWLEEIYRRLQQIDSGAVQLIPWEDARRRLRTRLGRWQAGPFEFIPRLWRKLKRPQSGTGNAAEEPQKCSSTTLTVRSSGLVRTQNSFLYTNSEPAGSRFADFHTSSSFEKRVLVWKLLR